MKLLLIESALFISPSVEVLGSCATGSDISSDLLFDHRPLELNEDDYQRVCQIPKHKVYWHCPLFHYLVINNLRGVWFKHSCIVNYNLPRKGKKISKMYYVGTKQVIFELSYSLIH